MKQSLTTRTQNLTTMGAATLVGALMVGLYAAVNAWATVTSDVVIARTTSWPTEVLLPTASEHPARATWPYQVMVSVQDAPAGARWLVQGADALTPALWALCLALLGLFLMRAGAAASVFDQSVLWRLRWLWIALAALAMVPTGLRIFGNNWLVDSQGWGTQAAHDPISLWMPTLACYLCAAFEIVLRHGAKLQADLAEVI